MVLPIVILVVITFLPTTVRTGTIVLLDPPVLISGEVKKKTSTQEAFGYFSCQRVA